MIRQSAQMDVRSVLSNNILFLFYRLLEELEDAKGVIIIRKLKKHNTMAKRKETKGQTTIYKTLHIKLNIK